MKKVNNKKSKMVVDISNAADKVSTKNCFIIAKVKNNVPITMYELDHVLCSALDTYIDAFISFGILKCLEECCNIDNSICTSKKQEGFFKKFVNKIKKLLGLGK